MLPRLLDLIPHAEEDLVDQLTADYIARRQRGEAVDPQDYLTRFPNHAARIADGLRLVDQTLGDHATSDQAGSRPAAAVEQAPDDSASMQGKQLGNYLLLDEIGRGGMGRVYRARDIRDGRMAAVKTLCGGNELSIGHMVRLSRESVAHRRLKHPNIVELYDTDTVRGTPYLAMELVEHATSLEDILRDPEKLPDQRQAAAWIRDIARAVAYCHQQGVVHRDLKPDNILLRRGQPMLTDFSIAFIDDGEIPRITAALTIIGTLPYMCPEQAEGDEQPAPAWDIYALGATLYALLAGQPPFVGPNPSAVIKQLVEVPPPPFHQFGLRVHPELEAICMKCLGKKPGARYASATDLADDLTQFLLHQRTRARPIRWWVRGLRETLRTHRTAVAVVAAAALVAVPGLIMAHAFQVHKQLAALTLNQGRAVPDAPPYSLNLLGQAATAASSETRAAAAAALVERNEPGAHAWLLHLAGDSDKRLLVHLAEVLSEHPTHPSLPEISHTLLKHSDQVVRASAIRLAHIARRRELIPEMIELAYSRHRTTRALALAAIVDLHGVANLIFADRYLADGPADGQQELLSRIARGRAVATPTAVMPWTAVGAEDERQRPARLALATLTGLPPEISPDDRESWWSEHGASWAPVLLHQVYAASPQDEVTAGDLIFRVNGQPLTADFPRTDGAESMITVIRNTALIDLAWSGSARTRPVYVATLAGQPLATTGPGIALAAARSAATLADPK